MAAYVMAWKIRNSNITYQGFVFDSKNHQEPGGLPKIIGETEKNIPWD